MAIFSSTDKIPLRGFMTTINIKDELKMAEFRSEIKEQIFEDIRDRKLFGKLNLWRTFMIRDFRNKYPKELREQVDLAIEELVKDNIFELNEHGYIVTPGGEETIYENSCYSVDSVITKILIHLRGAILFENSRWHRVTATNFRNELIVYEQRLFSQAINKMREEGLFLFDEINDAYIVTEKCQNTMFGL